MAGSVSLCAPNWSTNVVRLNSDASIGTDEFRRWLESIDFAGPAFECILSRPPEEIYMHIVDSEVAFVTFEFPPVDDALDRLEGWEQLLSEVCDCWGFTLMGHDGKSTVPLKMFHSVLSQDTSWKVIAETNGWPSID